MRGDLVRVLFEELPNSVALRFGQEISRLDAREDRVDVTLTGGERETADLLVGAEGVHSTLRARLFGDENSFLRTLGFDTAAFVFYDPALAQALATKSDCLRYPVVRSVFYPVPGGGIASLYLFTVRYRRRGPPIRWPSFKAFMEISAGSFRRRWSEPWPFPSIYPL